MKRYLNSNDLKRIQNALLDVLDSYCKEHNLIYFLSYGTLIGAVRHKGFIPWDDDIDVIMPRNDYETLIRDFNENNTSKTACLLSHKLDKSYYLPIAKLIDCTTVLKENLDVKYELGVYIDIFPLDNLSDSLSEANKRMKHGYKFNQEWKIKTMRWRKGRALYKNLFLLAGKLALIWKPISRIVENLDDYCCETNAETLTRYVGVICGIPQSYTKIFEKEWFDKTILVEFEGKQYYAPIGTNYILQILYGNYMQLPPADQQISHHSFDAWYKE